MKMILSRIRFNNKGGRGSDLDDSQDLPRTAREYNQESNK